MKWFETLTRLPKESPRKTVILVLGVSLICGFLVSVSSISLKPLHIENMNAEQRRQLQQLIERQPGIATLFESFDAQQIEMKIVNLNTGQYAQDIDPAKYDPEKATRSQQLSRVIPSNLDIAGIKRRPIYAPVYLVRSKGRVRFLILPIYGKGYASTLHALIGLEADGNTIIGLSIYQHGETPGLGGKVADQEWLGQWQGKKLRDSQGVVRLELSRAPLAPDSPGTQHRVEGITGATSTSRGVQNMVRFWLGDYGFGPFLLNLSSRNASSAGLPRGEES